jgi:hypothetical protein
MVGRTTKEFVETGGFEIAMQGRRHPKGAEEQYGE